MGKRVLVVEDHTDTRVFMKFMLEFDGLEVSEAINGVEAVEMVKENPPDLILMDLSLPILDGLSATAQIRELYDSTILPIIAITAHGSSYYEAALIAGCNIVISKPIKVEILEPLIEQYLVD